MPRRSTSSSRHSPGRESLGEGKLAGIQENNIHYWLGQAHRLLGQEEIARGWFERASHGLAQPSLGTILQRSATRDDLLSRARTPGAGRESEAMRRFETLIGYGQAHLNDDVAIDFFAVSLPDFLVFDADLAAKNELHCRYMPALGYLGLQKESLADQEFANILQIDSNHWAHLRIATSAARTCARPCSTSSRRLPFQFEFVPRRRECLSLFG